MFEDFSNAAYGPHREPLSKSQLGMYMTILFHDLAAAYEVESAEGVMGIAIQCLDEQLLGFAALVDPTTAEQDSQINIRALRALVLAGYTHPATKRLAARMIEVSRNQTAVR